MAVVVVDEGQLGVIELAAPLDGLGGTACGGNGAVGSVGIGGGDVTGEAATSIWLSGRKREAF